MKKVPLADEALDVAIFSLSLMGKNWHQYIAEAKRCLVTNGILVIAETTKSLIKGRLSNLRQALKEQGFEIYSDEGRGDFTFIEARELGAEKFCQQVTVLTGKFTPGSIASKVGPKASRQSRNIFMQINTPGASLEELKKSILPGLRASYLDLDNVSITFFGPDGKLWHRETFKKLIQPPPEIKGESKYCNARLANEHF